jgi:hypothetical protein
MPPPVRFTFTDLTSLTGSMCEKFYSLSLKKNVNNTDDASNTSTISIENRIAACLF